VGLASFGVLLNLCAMRALVTGGNRGLGFETCRQLIANGHEVTVAARELDAAKEAAHQLGAASFVRIDLEAEESIERARETLKSLAPLNALVNNAGTTFEGFNPAVAHRTLQVNTWGTLALTDALRPLLADDSNVVMVSSGMGELGRVGEAIRNRLIAPTLDRAALHALSEEFIEAVKGERVERAGFPRNAYSVSKVLLNGVTRVLTKEWGSRGPRVNAVCPGWVRTRMGGDAATRSVDKGASGIVWAATLGNDGPRGGFFRDGQRIAW
jgi:NAD(P)-dependent dehydrogenase (short-subunit alcohol dehydrogenase family)